MYGQQHARYYVETRYDVYYYGELVAEDINEREANVLVNLDENFIPETGYEMVCVREGYMA